MSSTGPSTLRERIAALQQRGASPQPTSPPRSQTLVNPQSTAGTALRAKIARFEQKGGTPIPRGSFGLGAPPQPTGRRNNELWGNRIPSAARPSGVSTSSTGRAVSLSVETTESSHRISTVDTQQSSMDEHTVLEDTPMELDTVQSWDIAGHDSDSPPSNPASPASSASSTSLPEESNHESSPRHQSARTPATASSPPASPPRIIFIQDVADNNPVQPALPQDANPPGVGLRVDVSPVPLQTEVIDNSPTPTSFVITPELLSNRLPAPSNDSYSSEGVAEDIPESSSSLVMQAVTLEPHIPPQPESPLIESSVIIPNSAEQPPRLELSECVAETPVSIPRESVTPPPPAESMATYPVQELVSHAEEPDVDSQQDDRISSLGEKNSNSPPIGDSMGSPFLAAADIGPEKKVAYDFEDPFQHHDDNTPMEQQAHPEPEIPLSTPPEVSEMSPQMQVLQIPKNLESASDPPAATSNGSVGLSAVSPSSEASGDEPSHVIPILDAFPAVPKFLPSSSLPARARTFSGRPRAAADRMSTSSTSSTKSTPSLSFSSTTSSNPSPTSAYIPAPHPPPDPRPASGLQRSLSQTARPISSVPTWYEDDSDDGEAGWANVIVTKLRY